CREHCECSLRPREEILQCGVGRPHGPSDFCCRQRVRRGNERSADYTTGSSQQQAVREFAASTALGSPSLQRGVILKSPKKQFSWGKTWVNQLRNPKPVAQILPHSPLAWWRSLCRYS